MYGSRITVSRIIVQGFCAVLIFNKLIYLRKIQHNKSKLTDVSSRNSFMRRLVWTLSILAPSVLVSLCKRLAPIFRACHTPLGLIRIAGIFKPANKSLTPCENSFDASKEILIYCHYEKTKQALPKRDPVPTRRPPPTSWSQTAPRCGEAVACEKG